MRTLGVDLAAQAPKTALCLIHWGDETATVESVTLGANDETIVNMAGHADIVAIDAPFGWPAPFVQFVRQHEAGAADHQAWTAERRDELRFRRTDHLVPAILGRWPLSVSSELIAVVAMRCAGVLAALGVTDRSGDGRVFEAYPALALARWGLASRGYKSARNITGLAALLAALQTRCPWLTLSETHAARCAASDDLFDALIASMVARTAALKLTNRPDEADVDRARQEGWIAVPDVDSLDHLFP